MLVSCIMPTRNRRHLANLAIRSYLAQDWHERELVVVDDGEDPIADLFEDVPGCLYLRVAGPQRLGTKRNLACEAARGEIIVHFDDDDWSAPGRIADQVHRMWAAEKAVSGYHSMVFWDGTVARRYLGGPEYSCGAALCYRKDWWRKHPFPAKDRAEDNDFVNDARAGNAIVASDAGGMMVALTHPGNTSPRIHKPWPEVPRAELPAAFFEDWKTALDMASSQ